jgi:integrase
LEQTREGVFVKRTKTGEERSIPLPSFVLRELQIHREKQRRNRELFGNDYQEGKDLIFAAPDGDFLKPDSVTAKVCVVMKKLGIHGSLHTLRHSQASELFDIVPFTTISKRLGHSMRSQSRRAIGRRDGVLQSAIRSNTLRRLIPNRDKPISAE